MDRKPNRQGAHRIVSVSMLLLLLMSVIAAAPLRDSVIDPRYHTYEEVVAYLDSIQQIPTYASILDVREIGRSNNEDLPIYAVKLSDNPTVDEDEPALLFLGQCHAEEILGLEITMGLVDSLLHGFDAMNSHVASILQNLEVWVVPTYNPEGLRVVHEGLDVTYRKNKTDTNHNGVFDYVPGIGYDIDGVDFNRNYDFNWIFGDAYEVGDYDYYRGPEPFSEAETRAIAQLARQEKFLLSVAYHSARSGTPEIIYYPWEWEHAKYSPDIGIISALANELSGRIINEAGDGNYAVTPGKTPRGNAHDWFYTQTGAIQFLIEVGTNNLQPNAQIIDDTVDRNLEGLFFLMDRAFGRTPESKSQIRGIIHDASDNFSLEGARVQLAKLHADGSSTLLDGLMMQPRVSDGFGRYRRLVEQGTYQVIASAPGFIADTVSAILASDSYATILDFSLQPMNRHSIVLNLLESAGIEDYQVICWDETQRDTLFLPPGLNQFDWQGDHITLECQAAGYFPELHSYDLTPYTGDIALQLSVDLPADLTTAYATPFDDLAGWVIQSGSWVQDNGHLRSQSAQCYGPGKDDLLRSPLIDLTVLPDATRLAVLIRHAYEVEWEHDSLQLELRSADNNELLLHHEWVSQDYADHQEVFFINGELPASAYLTLRLVSDSTVAFRGWSLDSLAVQLSATELVSANIQPEARGRSTFAGSERSTVQLAPNPFQTETHLSFDLPDEGPVQIRIFDIRGRQVYSATPNVHAGTNNWIWRGQDTAGHPVSAGVYLVQLQGTGIRYARKLLVMNNI